MLTPNKLLVDINHLAAELRQLTLIPGYGAGTPQEEVTQRFSAWKNRRLMQRPELLDTLFSKIRQVGGVVRSGEVVFVYYRLVGNGQLERLVVSGQKPATRFLFEMNKPELDRILDWDATIFGDLQDAVAGDAAEFEQAMVGSVQDWNERYEEHCRAVRSSPVRLPRWREGIGLQAASVAWTQAETELAAEGLLPILGAARYYDDKSMPPCFMKVWFRNGKGVVVETISNPGIYGTLASNPLQWRIVDVSLDGRAAIDREFPHERIHAQHYHLRLEKVLEAERINWGFAWGQPEQGYQYEQVSETPEGFYGKKGQKVRNEAKVPYRPARAPFTQCRVCGCTNENCAQCAAATGQPCYWVAPYLCSRCAAEQEKGGDAS